MKKVYEVWHAILVALAYLGDLLVKFGHALATGFSYAETWVVGSTHAILVVLAFIGVLLGFVVIMSALSLGIAWKKGWLRSWFTECGTNRIVGIDAGNSNVYIYVNIPGKFLSVDGTIEFNGARRFNGDRIKEATMGWRIFQPLFKWIQNEWGLYWVGFKFMNRKVHETLINRISVRRPLSSNMDPSQWVVSKGTELVTEVLDTFPTPVTVVDVKFLDKTEGTILLRMDTSVYRPKVMLYRQHGHQSVIDATTRTNFQDICKLMTYNQFIAADKTLTGNISDEMKRITRIEMEDYIGVKAEGVSVEIYNTSSDALEKAQAATTIAEEQGRATVATAKAQGDSEIELARRRGEAEVATANKHAEAQKILAPARVADVMHLADHFMGKNVDPNVAASQAVALGRVERLSDRNSPVNVFADGEGRSNVPLTERKNVSTEVP